MPRSSVRFVFLHPGQCPRLASSTFRERQPEKPEPTLSQSSARSHQACCSCRKERPWLDAQAWEGPMLPGQAALRPPVAARCSYSPIRSSKLLNECLLISWILSVRASEKSARAHRCPHLSSHCWGGERGTHSSKREHRVRGLPCVLAPRPLEEVPGVWLPAHSGPPCPQTWDHGAFVCESEIGVDLVILSQTCPCLFRLVGRVPVHAHCVCTLCVVLGCACMYMYVYTHAPAYICVVFPL